MSKLVLGFASVWAELNVNKKRRQVGKGVIGSRRREEKGAKGEPLTSSRAVCTFIDNDAGRSVYRE